MPHHLQQGVQQCIQACHQQANELRSLANQSQETSLRNVLTDGAHHIEMCIRQCEFCIERMQAGGQPQPAYQPGQYQGPQYQPGQFQPGLPR